MRADNRHHAERLKRKRRVYWNGDNGDARRNGIKARTPHPCSCMGCANQRAWYGDTMQERRSALALRD